VLSVPLDELLEDHFGRILRKLREEKGVTLSDMERIGVNMSSLRRIEKGEAAPSLELIQIIAKALAVDPSVFLESVSKSVAQDTMTSGQTSRGTNASGFSIHFAAEFAPTEIKGILTALANYYRACGGIGFELRALRRNL